MSMRVVLATGLWVLAGLVGSFVGTSARAQDDVLLTVTKSPGSEITLSWTGGAAVYGVFRAPSPLASNRAQEACGRREG